MTYHEAAALSPCQPQILADGTRPASQSGLATMLRNCDPSVLRETLASMADAHGFSWDADAMLRRVTDRIVLVFVEKL